MIASVVVSVGLACATARTSQAQSSEYTLDGSGEWKQTAAPAAGSDEAIIAQARRALADKKPERALSVLDPWIEKNENLDKPLLAQAYLLRGDAKTAAGNEYKALYDYEHGVIERFPATTEYVTALERELEIAVRYVNGLRYKWFGVRFFDASDIGEELLIRIQERLPGSRLAERAGIELADHYYRIHDLKLAGEAYELFLRNYPNSVHTMKAMKRRVESAVGQFKGPEYDTSSLKDAKVLIGRFATLYPSEAEKAGLNDGLIARIDESAAAELLESAKWYFKQNDLVSARYNLKRLVQKHPGTAAATIALETMKERGWLADAAKKTPLSAPGVPNDTPSVPVTAPTATETPAAPPPTPIPETKPLAPPAPSPPAPAEPTPTPPPPPAPPTTEPPAPAPTPPPGNTPVRGTPIPPKGGKP